MHTGLATLQFRPLERWPDLVYFKILHSRHYLIQCCIRLGWPGFLAYRQPYWCYYQRKYFFDVWVKGHHLIVGNAFSTYDLKDEKVLLTTENMMMMTHVFRCIDAVFTALPNICMPKYNKSREHIESRGRKLSFSRNATSHLSTRTFLLLVVVQPLLMVILLFFCSCNFAEKKKPFFFCRFARPFSR